MSISSFNEKKSLLWELTSILPQQREGSRLSCRSKLCDSLGTSRRSDTCGGSLSGVGEGETWKGVKSNPDFFDVRNSKFVARDGAKAVMEGGGNIA